MWKKILKTLVEIALIALVVYAVYTIINGIRLDSKHETTPWCVTEYKH